MKGDPVATTPSGPAARTAQLDQLLRDELVERIARALPADGTVEPLAGLYLQRVSVATDTIYGVAEPSFCVIAQGSKVMLMGDHRVRYDPAHYLLATAEVPVTGAISDAAPAQPYLSLRLTIDPGLVGAVMVEARQPAPRTSAAVRALAVSPLDASLLEAVVRLVRLLEAPTTAAFLAPLITREIIYRLLLGEQGDRLRQIAVFGGATQRIAAAIARIRQDVTQPLRIAELAREVGMSVSGFHAHFKAVTAMSPGQFQTQLRLQEARWLLLGEHLDAASAGARVGYADPAYFTRAYKRLFGAPPMRDVTQVRDRGAASGSGP
jgi:AraC-like DNA-binding protein